MLLPEDLSAFHAYDIFKRHVEDLYQTTGQAGTMIHIPDSIFPIDQNGARMCPRCRKVLPECQCPSFDPTRPKTDLFTPKVRLDKSGRKGKLVTLITGLPSDENWLSDFARALKAATGSGGTHYTEGENGVVELQGDRQEAVQNALRRENFKIPGKKK